MAKIPIPKGDFIPHPIGQHQGEIYSLQDEGVKETAFGEKHKVSVRIQSSTAMMDDGQPFIIQQWYTLSGHPKSSLRQFREMIAERPLTDEEAYNFDTDDLLLLHKQVGYVVIHNEGKEGGVYANIKAIWPLSNVAQKKPLDPVRVEYFLRLVDHQADNKLMPVENLEKYAKWVTEKKCTPDLLEKAIKASEAALKTKNIALPEQPKQNEGSDGDLPF